jgi:hypothetical protein
VQVDLTVRQQQQQSGWVDPLHMGSTRRPSFHGMSFPTSTARAGCARASDAGSRRGRGSIGGLLLIRSDRPSPMRRETEDSIATRLIEPQGSKPFES